MNTKNIKGRKVLTDSGYQMKPVAIFTALPGMVRELKKKDEMPKSRLCRMLTKAHRIIHSCWTAEVISLCLATGQIYRGTGLFSQISIKTTFAFHA
jgi:hypothetical protein